MDHYDVVVLGGGSGSQVATAAADAGMEAAVCEPGPLGGACITRGCVPSKALIHRADVCEEIRRADRFGIDAEIRGIDYGAITDAIHETVFEKAERQAASLRENPNVTLYEAAGRFVDDRTVELVAEIGDENEGAASDDRSDDGRRIRGEQVVIAVGSRPMVPPIDGLEGVDFLTSDDALYLRERPDELVVIGGGYIGAELGSFFAALGTDVSIVGRSDALVPNEDQDVSEAVTRSLERRCDVYTGYEASSITERAGPGSSDGITVTADPPDESDADAPVEIEAGDLLVATGRRPNTDDLGLEHTAVATVETGHVETDDTLETDEPGVWALGDVLSDYPFKHVADREAEVVTANVLAEADSRSADPDRTAIDYDAMAHAIFTTPRVASVGATESELTEAGRAYETAHVTYDAAPLGLIFDEPNAFVKVLAGPDGDRASDDGSSGEILGCHVVGPQASTLIHEVVVAMERGAGTVDDIAETVHVHPALNEVLLAAFDELADRPYSTAPDWRDVGVDR